MTAKMEAVIAFQLRCTIHLYSTSCLAVVDSCKWKSVPCTATVWNVLWPVNAFIKQIFARKTEVSHVNRAQTLDQILLYTSSGRH